MNNSLAKTQLTDLAKVSYLCKTIEESFVKIDTVPTKKELNKLLPKMYKKDEVVGVVRKMIKKAVLKNRRAPTVIE